MKLKLVYILFLIFYLSTAMGEVYKTVDEDGNITLLDQAYLSAIIINDLHSSDFQNWLADCNYDGEKNVIDILMISDMVE